MASDSALTGQSPPPTGRPVAAVIAITVGAVLVVLIVGGLRSVSAVAVAGPIPRAPPVIAMAVSLVGVA